MNTVAVVPAYQAASTVGQVTSELLALWPESPLSHRVIVVDDGSTDPTAERARAGGALVVSHPLNLGKGAALRTGLRRAAELGAEAAVTVDADGQHPAAEALRLAQHPAPPGALVLAVRDLRRAGAPRPNRFSNAVSNLFLSAFSQRRLADTQCGLRRYPLPATLKLGVASDGYAFEAEVVLRAARAGWPIEQVSVEVIYPPEEERSSHFHVVRDPARIVARVLVTVASTMGRR